MQFRINERENKIDKQTLNKNIWDEDKKYFTQNLENEKKKMDTNWPKNGYQNIQKNKVVIKRINP